MAEIIKYKNVMLMNKSSADDGVGEIMSPITMVDSVKVPLIRQGRSHGNLRNLSEFVDIPDIEYNPSYYFNRNLLSGVVDLSKVRLVDPYATDETAAIKIVHEESSPNKNVKAFFCFTGMINSNNGVNIPSNKVIINDKGYSLELIYNGSVTEINKDSKASNLALNNGSLCMFYTVVKGPESDEIMAVSTYSGDENTIYLLAKTTGGDYKLISISHNKVSVGILREITLTSSNITHMDINTKNSLLFYGYPSSTQDKCVVVINDNYLSFEYDSSTSSYRCNRTQFQPGFLLPILNKTTLYFIDGDGDIKKYEPGSVAKTIIPKSKYNPGNMNVSLIMKPFSTYNEFEGGNDIYLLVKTSKGISCFYTLFGEVIEYNNIPSDVISILDIHIYFKGMLSYTEISKDMPRLMIFDNRRIFEDISLKYLNPYLNKKMKSNLPDTRIHDFYGITKSYGKITIYVKLPLDVIMNSQACISYYTRSSSDYTEVDTIAGVIEDNSRFNTNFIFPHCFDIEFSKKTNVVTPDGIQNLFYSSLSLPGVSKNSNVTITFDSESLSKLEPLNMLDYIDEKNYNEIYFYSKSGTSSPVKVNATIEIDFNN